MNLIKYYFRTANNALSYTKNLFLYFKILYISGLGFLGRYSKSFDKLCKKKSANCGEYIFNTPFGKYLCYNMHDFRMMDKKYEIEIQNVIKEVLKSNTTESYFINIGANIGRYSIDIAKNYGYNVLAFEPAPETYYHLRSNVVLSKLEDKITTYNIALGDKNEMMAFEYLPYCNGGSYIKGCGSDKGIEIQVSVKKFDDLGIDPKIIEKTKLIIMDVKGFEYSVMKGMSDALDKFHDINIIIEIASKKSEDEKNKIFKFMKLKGFSYRKVDNEDYLFYK